MDREGILYKLDQVLKDRGVELDIYGEGVSVILGGSSASGLSTEQSDMDIRVVRLSDVEDLLGLGEEEHSKLVEGVGGVNGCDDLDVEIFTTRRLLKDLFHGEIVANEILFTEGDLVLKDTPWLADIRDNYKLFTSKRFLYKSLGYYRGARHRAIPKGVDKMRSSHRKARVEAYGYDTKNAERSIRILQIIEEYLDKGTFNIKRENAFWLRSVRLGLLDKDEYLACVEDKHKEIEDRVEELILRNYGDRDKVNQFMVEFMRRWGNIK